LCGCRIGFDEGTSTKLIAKISANHDVAIATLDARLAFATLDPQALQAIPSDGGPVTLPATTTLPLPEASGALTITLDAIDGDGRKLSAAATTGVIAGTDATVELELGNGLPDSCFDGVANAGEVDVDCGGPCPACSVGRACLTASDCATGFCPAGTCQLATGLPSWIRMPDAPVGRIGAAVTLGQDGLLYVYGGSLNDGVTDYAEVDVFDSEREVWGSAPLLTLAHERLGGAIDGHGTIYAIGGSYGASVESFTPGQSQWDSAPALPNGRRGIVAVTDRSGMVYAFGGSDGPNNYADALMLTPSGWLSRTPMPDPHAQGAGALATDGKLVVVGGYLQINVLTNTAVAFDPAANTWSALPPMLHTRSDLAAVTAPDGRIYAIGGFAGTVGLFFVEAMSPGAGWVDVDPVAFDRDSCAAALAPDGRIILVGGRSPPIGDGRVEVEAYGPRVQLGAPTAGAGDVVSIAGSNFAPNATVRIYFDGLPVELSATDAIGTLTSTTVQLPMTTPGAHAVRVIDDRSGYPITKHLSVQ
jgi:hypothetical protein